MRTAPRKKKAPPPSPPPPSPKKDGLAFWADEKRIDAAAERYRASLKRLLLQRKS